MSDRAAYGIMGVMGGIFLIGMVAEEPSFPETKWVDDPGIIRGFKKDPGRYTGEGFKTTTKDLGKPSYWEEYLEDLEARGLQVDDPEAVEYLELNYK